MTFRQKIAAYTLGILTDQDLPGIAMTGMEEGFESASLHILAGCNSNENRFHLSEYYVNSLKQLNLIEPDSRTAVITVLKSYANNIIDGKTDAYHGFEKMENILNRTPFHYSNLLLTNCYVDYISMWEVKSHGLQLHVGDGLSKEQYLEKTSKDLIINLKQWIENIDTLL